MKRDPSHSLSSTDLSFRFLVLFFAPPLCVGILLLYPLSGSYSSSENEASPLASYPVYVFYFQSIYNILCSICVYVWIAVAHPPTKSYIAPIIGGAAGCIAAAVFLIGMGSEQIEKKPIFNAFGVIFINISLAATTLCFALFPRLFFRLSDMEQKMLDVRARLSFLMKDTSVDREVDEQLLTDRDRTESISSILHSSSVSRVSNEQKHQCDSDIGSNSVHDPLDTSTLLFREQNATTENIWTWQDEEGVAIWIPVRQWTISGLLLIVIGLLYYFCQTLVRQVGLVTSLTEQSLYALIFQIGLWMGRVIIWNICSLFYIPSTRCVINHTLSSIAYYFQFIFYRTMFEVIDSYLTIAVLQIEHVAVEFVTYFIFSLPGVFRVRRVFIQGLQRIWKRYLCPCMFQDPLERELREEFVHSQTNMHKNIGLYQEEANFLDSWHRFLRQQATSYVFRQFTGIVATLNFLIISLLVSNVQYLNVLYAYVGSGKSRSNSLVYEGLAISVTVECLFMWILHLIYHHFFSTSLLGQWPQIVSNPRTYLVLLLSGMHIATDSLLGRVVLKFQ